MTAPHGLEPLMTAEDVAAFLRISISGVYRLRARGELPAVPIGSLWRWNPDVVRAFARGEQVGTTGPTRARRRV